MSQSNFSGIQKEKISTSTSSRILSGFSKIDNVTVKKWLPALVTKATACKAKLLDSIEASIARVHGVKAGERITIGAACASAVFCSSDDEQKYLNQFQMTKFNQGSIQRAILTDDNKRLTEPLLRKATVQAGKRFLLESTLTKKDDVQLFSWKYEIDDDNSQYRLTYTNQQTSSASFLPTHKGKVSTYLNQENISKLKDIENSTFQDLCEKYRTQDAKHEMAKYEWRYIPSSHEGKGEFVYSTNSTEGRPLFHDRDGLFPGFLKLDVLAEMLTLESPPSISRSAERGSCMAFSAQWLDLMIGEKSKLSEIEATLEQRRQLYPGGLSSNKSMTVAQRRMAILSAQNGREAAQYQKAYRGYPNLEADYRKRIAKLVDKAFETMEQTINSLNTAELNALLDSTGLCCIIQI